VVTFKIHFEHFTLSAWFYSEFWAADFARSLLRSRSDDLPLPLRLIFWTPLTAPLRCSRFSAHSAPFSAPLTCSGPCSGYHKSQLPIQFTYCWLHLWTVTSLRAGKQTKCYQRWSSFNKNAQNWKKGYGTKNFWLNFREETGLLRLWNACYTTPDWYDGVFQPQNRQWSTSYCAHWRTCQRRGGTGTESRRGTWNAQNCSEASCHWGTWGTWPPPQTVWRLWLTVYRTELT